MSLPTKPKLTLTVQLLRREAVKFARVESTYPEPSLYGVTDGKAIGTYLEQKFKAHLATSYNFIPGNSAAGIDFPGLDVDMKVTSKNQPQSSCPFRSGRQKIYGLGYSLLIFVYSKTDDPVNRTGLLDIVRAVFVEDYLTADYQTTVGLNQILANGGNQDDLVAFIGDRMLPVGEIEANAIAVELLAKGSIPLGYLTISNALQWRLQYTRAITQAGKVQGLIKIV